MDPTLEIIKLYCFSFFNNYPLQHFGVSITCRGVWEHFPPFFWTRVHRTFGEARLYCLKRFMETSELGLCSKVQIVLGCSS